MTPETVNIPPGAPQTKLSKLQKMILTDLYEKLQEHLKFKIDYHGWDAKHGLKGVIYSYAINSKGLSWRIARRSEGKTHLSHDEVKADFKARRAEAFDSMTEADRPFLGFLTKTWNIRQRRGFHNQLLPSFRASLSRSLRRLAARGLITLVKYEKYDWDTSGKPKTTSIYLTLKGLEVAKQLPPRPHMLTV